MDMNATLFGQLISFVLFVWFCMKYVWPPIMGAIEKRQKEIADSLSSAELAKKEVESAKINALDFIQKAKADAQVILEEANKRRLQLLEEAKEEALREKEKIVNQGLAEINSERKKAQEILRKQVAQIVITGAEKVIQRSVDEAASCDIIDKMIAEL